MALGFDGDQVSLSLYSPNIAPSGLQACGKETFILGVTPLPSIAALSMENASSGAAVIDASIIFNGD
jgi:hypothetical protein